MSNAAKNPSNIQTVDFARHGKLKVKPNSAFTHAKDRHIVAVNVSELGIASSNFPVVFVKNPREDRYMLTAMLGLKTGENIYYGDEFWESCYVPLAVQRHPFVVGYDDRVEDDTQLAACIEMDSPTVSETDGIALFQDDGTPSEMLRSVQQLLGSMFEAGKFTDQFIQKLGELDLITPFELILQLPNGNMNRITGMATIDEKKLKALSAEQLKELQTRDFLAPCHLMLVSLYQLNQLIRRRNRLGGEQITNFRIEFPGDQPAAANA
jgi:hypothetical protein